MRGSLPRVLQRHRATALQGGGVINPFTITGGKALRWYDLQNSTAVAAEWPAIIERNGGTSLLQTDTDRKPAAALSANGLNVATFDGTDTMLQALESGNNGTAKWWLYMRVKLADLGGNQALYTGTTAAGASANRVWVFSEATTGKINVDVYAGATTGRRWVATTVGLVAATWASIYVQWDNTKTPLVDLDGLTDAKFRLFYGNTASALTQFNVGAGADPASMVAATGNVTIGGAVDTDTPTSPIRNGGQIQLMVTGAEPLTSAELTALNLHQFPT